MKEKKEKAPSELLQLNLTLQKKNIELLEAMHYLTQRIDNLVNVFEEAAKNVANVEEDHRIKELATKLEELLDQNKSLANGLLLLERYIRSKSLETNRRV
jgi:translation initiation factor 2 alpha subunit (eIF-2alpha)